MVSVVLLLGVTAVWGWTFVLVKAAIAQFPTVPFLAIRFAIALVVMAAIVRRVPSRRVIAVGLPIGAALAAGYLLQTWGLARTSPGNAGLITGLFFVFTPVLERIFGRTVGLRTVTAVLVALAGTALLTAGGPAGIGAGDALVLGCAFFFAMQIVLLSHWSPGLPAADLTLVQMGSCVVVFSAGGLAQFQLPSGSVWFALGVTGILASALAFYIQTWAQSHMSASRTALVLASEPAWALFFSVLLAGQRLSAAQALGAALVLAAILWHEIPSGRASP